jgi:hypothetical protein
MAVGDELHCPRCGGWHAVFALNTAGTPHTRHMLSWESRASQYYAGTLGGKARYEAAARSSPPCVAVLG